MRDVNFGWLIRYIHANVASFFFIFVYIHIGKGLYYGSYKSPRVLLWSIGVIIFLIMIGTAFLGYVLPWGGMSFWGATVITNMLSAIPWVGKDLVESNIIKLSLPMFCIGTISPYALKNGRKKRSDTSQFLSSAPFSFLAMLIGLIDGDGYILIHKTAKGYIKINLTIALNIRDLSVLQYIHSVLDLGKITIYPKSDEPDTCKLIINRTDLQEVLFPLFLHHKLFFLTDTRREQFDKAMLILRNDIKLFNEIPAIVPIEFPLPKTALSYTTLPFFNNWIVGFTIAEGSFLVKSNNDACFQLRQCTHKLLFEAILLVFGSNRKIVLENNKKHEVFSVSSIVDIQQVINFFSFSGHHSLLGHQNIRYEQWLIRLRDSKRYCNLKFPSI